ncbi:OLC1v1020097C2 [Oldenlandia corymbosa var. corymbosa]|uniref:OLC1v1020097C2 n=1 Tax=Oldenlandia corymbosa var. corymbosa TaxID=529605 RepID=A0AAV1EFJ3_OLDCO|nr:OLC1v1020097C2 [Oldenlandia corymbosa var. corymbosa]
MTQSQAPPKKEILSTDSKEVNRSSSDGKSRVSSPISNSPSANIQSSPAVLPPNPVSSSGPLSAVAPKRKRPRQVSENTGNFSVRSSPISSTTGKFEADQTPKAEISSPSLEKNPGSAAESGYEMSNLSNSQTAAATELRAQEPMKVDSELKAAAERLGEGRDLAPRADVASSPKKESATVKAESNREDAATGSALSTKSSLTGSDVGNQREEREEKFQIDLEAPPPQGRYSPERENDVCLGAVAMNSKPNIDSEMKPVDKQDEKMAKIVNENGNFGADEKKVKSALEDFEALKRAENKGRSIDLQLDLEKPERENGPGNKLQPAHKPHQQQQPSLKGSKEEPHTERAGQPNSLPLPMSMASWPGGLPPMGYMAPIQGVVSMDGSTVSPTPIQPFFSQPRPKRCATHCYIARNINYLQQFMKMNPFWSAAAAGSAASLFGPKNLSVVPSADLHGNVAGRSASNGQDKGPGLAMFPGHSGKEKAPQPANIADANQRKQQILLQPAMPPVAPNNILHGPAFIFPLNHQQAAVAAASALPASAKPPPATTGAVVSGSASNSTPVGVPPTAAGAATAVSFNYPNMPTNETQYLAILQNNGYPFPLPTVGAPPNFRGTHPQAMPLFNGSFYSSQIIHPSQLQQQQQQQQQVPQSQQMQQSNQNASQSSGSSSSQKHLQGQQQRPAGNAASGNAAIGNLHNFPAPKNRQTQQLQHSQNQHIPASQSRAENEIGSEDSPSTADSRGSRPPVNIYGQNFAMPMHPQNYALLTPPAAVANAPSSSGNGNQSDKKQQQTRQVGGLKNVVESMPAQAFAMSFASLNGATGVPGIDLSSMAQNQAILQSLPEATRQNIQMMAANAAHVAQQRKNFRISEDNKTGGDSSNADDERKGLAGKSLSNVGQSIAFSRSEFTDASTSTQVGNSVIDSSARPINLSSGPSRSSRSAMPNSVGAVSGPSAQQQAQHQSQQMLQQFHKQQQQLVAAAAAWNKNSTPNGSVYPEHLSSSSAMTAKFPNAHSPFAQNLVQNNNSGSPNQSPQWKNSSRTTPPQVSSSFASSSASTLKSLPQQQGRNQQSHSQISFGANQKSSPAPGQQQPPTTNQSPASPMMVGSPSTSSMSKGASGSPRTTTSATASSKTGQASSLSGQQPKNSSVPGQKSSPVGGRNVQSILGNSHIAGVSSSSGAKSQMQQLPPQQQLAKNIQQQHAQLYFSNYVQGQPPISSSMNSSSSAPGSGGYYVQRRRPDQQQQPQHQQPPGSSAPSSGMLSLSVSLSGTSTTDPAKAIAAATAAVNNMKGGGLTTQSILQATQFAAQQTGNQHQLMPGFAYVHAVPAGVPVKPSEQKQPAGEFFFFFF